MDKIKSVSSQKQVASINATRIRMLYESIRDRSPSQYGLLAVLTLIGLQSEMPLLWVLFVAGTGVICRLLIQWNILRFFSLETDATHDIWEKRMSVGLSIEALIVTTGLMLMIEPAQQLLFFIMMSITIILAAVSSVLLVASLQSHVLRVFALLIPAVVELLVSGQVLYQYMAGLLVFVVAPSLIIAGKKMHETFMETLQLRFENSTLLATALEEKKRAEKASADKTKFLATASHDLRQPIHALELFSDALEHELDKPVQLELMGKVKESTAAMNGLLYSLLDISRLDANIVQANKSTLLLNHLIESLVQTTQPLAARKGVKLVFDAKPCAVVSDAVLLESILHNLLTNAVKYTHDGSINISCEADGKDTVQVIISDTGVGIPEKDQHIIFDDFIQLDNPERDRRKGLGLGLAIVKRTCELLGHQISVQSEQGVGSKFTLTLEAANMGDITPQAQVQVKGGILQANVLVIDDERTILEGMEKMLTRWGCEVICAANLSEAMEKIKGKSKGEAQDKPNDAEQPIDLIIADYRLADNQLGTHVIQAVKQYLDAPDLPAMIITGDTGPEQLKDIESVGYHVLHKPVRPMRLRALMQNLLNQD